MLRLPSRGAVWLLAPLWHGDESCESMPPVLPFVVLIINDS